MSVVEASASFKTQMVPGQVWKLYTVIHCIGLYVTPPKYLAGISSVVGGHITKCNNSSAEKTYFLFLGRALLFFKKHLLLRYPGVSGEIQSSTKNFIS
jgi:hypothetical protein